MNILLTRPIVSRRVVMLSNDVTHAKAKIISIYAPPIFLPSIFFAEALQVIASTFAAFIFLFIFKEMFTDRRDGWWHSFRTTSSFG